MYYFVIFDKMPLRPDETASRAVVWRPWFKRFNRSGSKSTRVVIKLLLMSGYFAFNSVWLLSKPRKFNRLQQII